MPFFANPLFEPLRKEIGENLILHFLTENKYVTKVKGSIFQLFHLKILGIGENFRVISKCL